jgi:cullin 3
MNNIKEGNQYFENEWKLIDQAINEIYKKNSSELSYEELYRTSYLLILNRHGEEMYSRVTLSMTEYLKIICKRVIDANEENFLNEVCLIWEEYKISIQRIRDILMYMVFHFFNKSYRTEIM